MTAKEFFPEWALDNINVLPRESFEFAEAFAAIKSKEFAEWAATRYYSSVEVGNKHIWYERHTTFAKTTSELYKEFENPNK